MVLRIEASDLSSGGNSIGTGFIIRHSIPNRDSSVFVLVTCRHVLYNGEGSIKVVINLSDPSDKTKPKLGETLIIGPAQYKDAYCSHKHPNVDVAAINISEIPLKHNNMFFKWMEVNQIVDYKHDELVPDRDVVFVGYPYGYFDEVNNLPILRSGKIATIPKVDFNGLPQFLIDAQVYPGSSGSPVFVKLSNNYYFLGMLGKSATKAVPVELKNIVIHPVITDYIGLGVVYKPEAIMEVVKTIAERS